MEEKYTETFKTWNKIATMYEDKFMNLDLYHETYDFICNSIPLIHAKILEIGCGPGNITKYLLTKRPDFNILGIDVAPNMVKLAKKNNPTASFSIMDCRKISEFNTTFDAIIGGFCLPYLIHTDGYKLIVNCYNLLNKNGLMYISFVEGDSNKSYYQIGSTGDGTYFYFYNLEELIKQVQNINFEQIKIFKVSYKKSENDFETHTILTAIKK